MSLRECVVEKLMLLSWKKQKAIMKASPKIFYLMKNFYSRRMCLSVFGFLEESFLTVHKGKIILNKHHFLK